MKASELLKLMSALITEETNQTDETPTPEPETHGTGRQGNGETREQPDNHTINPLELITKLTNTVQSLANEVKELKNAPNNSPSPESNGDRTESNQERDHNPDSNSCDRTKPDPTTNSDSPNPNPTPDPNNPPTPPTPPTPPKFPAAAGDDKPTDKRGEFLRLYSQDPYKALEYLKKNG